MPAPDAPGPSDAEVSALARSIVERPEYRRYDPESYRWIAEFFERLGEWLQWLQDLRIADPALYWLIMGGLLLTCLLLVAHIVYTIVLALRVTPPPVEEGVAPRSRADLVGEANELAERGRHLEAAHRLWIATLRTLAERRVIELRPQDANHVVRARLRGALPEPLYQQLTSLIGHTEARWFGADGARDGGDAERDAQLYARWQSALQAVQRTEVRR